MKILIVDDDPVALAVLEKNMRARELAVRTAQDGVQAWDILERERDIRLVLADWMMPGLSGPQLCRKIRDHGFPWYIYIILLTARSRKEDIIEGLNLGADDYMTKPLDMDELNVRINAGLRIINLNERLREANETMRKDLESGRKAQQSLLPRDLPTHPDFEFASRFYPSTYVSGDIYNIFRLDENHIGLFNIDVSGHGVPAALFSVGISQRMNNDLYPRGLLKIPIGKPPHYAINPPEKVARLLDEDDMLGRYDKYFTMVYAVLDTKAQAVDFFRAGHNRPLLIHADGDARYIDGGGPPIGMGLAPLPAAGQRLSLQPGDRFIIFSDGINEARSTGREDEYGHERVRQVLTRHLGDPLADGFDRLIEDVKRFQGTTEFGDDISIIGFSVLPS